MVRPFLHIGIFLCLIYFTPVHSQINQDALLAQQYQQNGELDKALDIYEKLWKQESSIYYYRSYFNLLMETADYKTAEKVCKKQIKESPENYTLQIDLGKVYSKQDEKIKAEKQFESTINALKPDQFIISSVANAFLSINETDFALATYQKGQSLLGTIFFNYEIGKLYERKSDYPKAIDHYLSHLKISPVDEELIQNTLQNIIQDDKNFSELKSQLFKRIQKSPNDIIFSKLLIWQYVQKQDYESAFTQAKALDRRLKNNGDHVYELAKLAKESQAFDAAIIMYQSLVEKGPGTYYYFPAQQELLSTRKLKVTSGLYTEEDIQALKHIYQDFLKEYGKNNNTIQSLRDLASLYARYLNDINEAISLLEEAIAIHNIKPITKAECKLDLGDYYIISGEIWEASLLYSQVDKAYKDEAIGEEAKLRNAYLSYYIGEFEWAKAQLDVLKASTTELISNNAMTLSFFIMDNFDLDTTIIPMSLYARADLLRFQNRYEEAISALDSILNLFPNHSLTDDVYYAFYNIKKRQQKFTEAAQYLELIRNNYSNGILNDDALFNLAILNEQILNNKEKALELFETLILNHKGSIYSIEARKHYRALRGDNIN